MKSADSLKFLSSGIEEGLQAFHGEDSMFEIVKPDDDALANREPLFIVPHSFEFLKAFFVSPIQICFFYFMCSFSLLILEFFVPRQRGKFQLEFWPAVVSDPCLRLKASGGDEFSAEDPQLHRGYHGQDAMHAGNHCHTHFDLSQR